MPIQPALYGLSLSNARDMQEFCAGQAGGVFLRVLLLCCLYKRFSYGDTIVDLGHTHVLQSILFLRQDEIFL